MAVTSKDLAEQLEQSGILSAEQISDARSEAGITDGNQRGDKLAQQLVKQGKLTKFQAQLAYGGKAKALVMGSYVILDKLGEGGMGQVYKARHKRMKREVALKVLAPKFVKDEGALQRFHREVEAAARLTHPNIVTAYDADETRGTHYLVMEFVPGQDLSELVKTNGPLPVGQAVDFVLQAARGLAYAHGQGVVHRDIKPSNLLLDSASSSTSGSSGGSAFGTIKILDMGLARFEEGDADQAAALTGTGMLMGTIDYMAPEQAMDSKTADHRADIYSLGATLYFLIAGQPMYQGDTVMKRIMAHQGAEVPQLPVDNADLQSLFERMVAKSVDDRFTPTEALVANLEEWLQQYGDSNLKAAIPEQVANDQPADDLEATVIPTNLASVETSTAGSVLDDTVVPKNPGQRDGDNRRQSKASRPTKRKTDRSHTPEKSSAVTRAKSGGGLFGNRKLMLIAGGVLATLLLLGVIVFRFSGKNGTVVVELQGAPEVTAVEIDGREVSFTPSNGDKQVTFSVASGSHSLSIRTAHGVELTTDLGEKPLEIKAGGSATLRAWVDKKPSRQSQGADVAQRAPGGEKPDMQLQSAAAENGSDDRQMSVVLEEQYENEPDRVAETDKWGRTRGYRNGAFFWDSPAGCKSRGVFLDFEHPAVDDFELRVEMRLTNSRCWFHLPPIGNEQAYFELGTLLSVDGLCELGLRKYAMQKDRMVESGFDRLERRSNDAVGSGEWRQLRIVRRGRKYSFIENGQTIYSYLDDHPRPDDYRNLAGRIRLFVVPSTDEPASMEMKSLRMVTRKRASEAPFPRPEYDPSPLPKIGTWEPTGTADIGVAFPEGRTTDTPTLPGLVMRPAKLAGIRRWNLETRQPRSHSWVMEFSPDGRLLAVGSADGPVRIYDSTSMDLKQILPARASFSGSPALSWHSSGTKLAVSSGSSSRLTIWTPDGKNTFSRSTQYMSPRFSPDGTLLLTTRSNEIRLYDPDGKLLKAITDQRAKTVSTHSGNFTWAPDSQSFATLHSDNSLKIWSRDGDLLNETKDIEALSYPGYAVNWSPDGKWIGVVDESKPTEIQRISPDGSRGDPIRIDDAVRRFQWTPDGNVLIRTASDLRIVESESGKIVSSYEVPMSGEGDRTIAISSDGKQIAMLSHDRVIFAGKSSATTGQTKTRTPIIGVSWNADGSKFLTIAKAGVSFWKANGQHLLDLPDASQAAWHPNGKTIVLASNKTSNLAVGIPGQKLKTIRNQHQYSRVQWSCDGQFILGVVSDWRSAHVMTSDGQLVQQFVATKGNQTRPVFSTTTNVLAMVMGAELFTASPDTNWQLQSRRKLNRPAYDPTWSPDGQYLAIDDAGVLRIEGETFVPVSEFGPGIVATWNPTSALAIHYTGDSTPRLMDVRTGQFVKQHAQREGLTGADWHPSRDMFTVAQNHSMITTWDADAFEPYWRTIVLPDSKSVTMTPAGQIMHGDRATIDKHLVYYIENDEGRIEMLTPTDFEKRIGQSLYVPGADHQAN